MKIMILCDFFAKENEAEVISQAKGVIEYSANVFQGKLIDGFKKEYSDVSVISAPEIGSYPNRSKLISFKKFQNFQNICQYVSFNNIWGFRNISRAKSIKKALCSFIESKEQQKVIVIYSVHTPFLEAAAYAKKRDPRVRICLIVPDLPQYMNLNAKKSILYRLVKKVDIKLFNKFNEDVDTYVLLTEAMGKIINPHNKPYCVAEGIVDSNILNSNLNFKYKMDGDKTAPKYIVYTGKMNEKFGVKKLVDAFFSMPEDNFRLVLCGKGDCDDYIMHMVEQDKRILFTGQIPHEEALKWLSKAHVLVNPRENNEDYTKYSFPSKLIEYLATGKPTVAYMLDGMPSIYTKMIYPINEAGLAGTIKLALETSEEVQEDRIKLIKHHFESLTGKELAKRIMSLTNNFEEY